MDRAASFQALTVWQHAHKFVLWAYRLTAGFPAHEMYGLTNQLRRAAVSIAANIAEGFRRKGQADKARMLNIAQGSLEECRYYLLLAEDLHYASTDEARNLLEHTSRLLNRYTAAITERIPRTR
jgi:four helix bundle protein